MPANRKSVYLTDDTLAELRLPERGGENDKSHSLSGRLNIMVARYARLIAEVMPTFTADEWGAIFDANNGPADGIMPDSLSMVWANVHDAKGMAEQWGVDVKKLITRMQSLSPAEGIAVLEAIDRFWLNTHLDAAAGMEMAGVKIAQGKKNAAPVDRKR